MIEDFDQTTTIADLEIVCEQIGLQFSTWDSLDEITAFTTRVKGSNLRLAPGPENKTLAAAKLEKKIGYASFQNLIEYLYVDIYDNHHLIYFQGAKPEVLEQ